MSNHQARLNALVRALSSVLKHWAKPDLTDVAPVDLAQLYSLRLLQQQLLDSDSTQTTPKAQVQAFLEESLTAFAVSNAEAVALLQARFIHDKPRTTVMQEVAVSESHYHRLQKAAFSDWGRFLLAQDLPHQTAFQQAVEARLNTPNYDKLFGVSEAQSQLSEAIANAESHWLIAIDGLGGIGKTSLADSAVRQLLTQSHFYDIGWVSAKQQTFVSNVGQQATGLPALNSERLITALLNQLRPNHPLPASAPEQKRVLTDLLKQQPHLIVVDNLETIADYEALLPTLRELANPTKFLLTSRESLHHHSQVFSLHLDQLSFNDSLAFIQAEANLRGMADLQNATPENLQAIYQTVGGNPLALKLVIGQLRALPFDQVLTNLKQAQGKTNKDLYAYIYWQAWQLLNPAGQQAFLSMAFVAEQGGSFTHLAQASGLSDDELSQALDQLVGLSLVEPRGALSQKRYHIHRLTETFLLMEALQWQSTL